MPKARVNSTTVSLTEDELEKLDALYRVAWGSSYNPDRTQRKIAKALDRIKTQQEAYANRHG
jgi:hypothetical protein